jgi:hypothetical protein
MECLLNTFSLWYNVNNDLRASRRYLGYCVQQTETKRSILCICVRDRL